MADFDLRRMLDRYLHDYLIKRNMHEPAEIFWNEANLAFDPEVPPAIDVPEGFLLEWWNMSYEFEFFRAWLNQHVTPISEATQEQNASQSGHFFMNSQPSEQLLVNSASTMSAGSKSMALHGSGNALQAFSPSSHQEGLLTTTWGNYTPINYANTIGQKSEPLVLTTTETANTAFVEEDTDPWIENLVSSFWVFDQDQKELHDKLALGEVAYSPGFHALGAPTLRPNHPYCNQKISGSTSQALLADDNTSETSDCTSQIPKLSTTADSSTVHQLDTNTDKSVSTSMECV